MVFIVYLQAGHADGGESFKQAMVREAKEEINLSISTSDLELAFISYRLVENNLERVDFFFVCSNFDENEIKNIEPEKCSELSWQSLDNQAIIDHVKTVLMEIEKGNNYKSFGFEEGN